MTPARLVDGALQGLRIDRTQIGQAGLTDQGIDALAFVRQRPQNAGIDAPLRGSLAYRLGQPAAHRFAKHHLGDPWLTDVVARSAEGQLDERAVEEPEAQLDRLRADL